MDTSPSLAFNWLMIIWRAVCFSYRIRPMKTNEIEQIYIDTYWRLFIFRPKLSILSKSQYVKHSFCCAFHLNKRQRERETPSYRYFTHFRYIWCWALEFIKIMFVSVRPGLALFEPVHTALFYNWNHWIYNRIIMTTILL